MTCISRLIVCFISLAHLIIGSKISQSDEKAAREFLESLNKKSAEITSKLVGAQWEFEIQHSVDAKQELFQATSEAIKNARTSFQTVLTSYPWNSYSDPDIRRQLKLYSEIGILALPDEKYQEFQQIISELEVIQQNTTVCDYYNRTKCDLHLHPDIQQKLKISLNLEEISYLATEWKRLTEPKLRILLDRYVNLSNQAAVLNNYKNYKEYSLRNIEISNPKQEMENLWESVKPLYNQIHAYVRRKLRNIYGKNTIPQEGAIPAELLGDVWYENWAGVADRMLPFPEEDDTNITEVMINLNYTPQSIRKLAENYFTSMNFTVPDQLWYNETSKEHKFEEVCHPKIFNFYKDNNIRIKDCGKISVDDYLEDIRLLAKVQYMLQYSHQPFIYQTPADPGLEIAVSHVLTLSASTFNNLKRLGLYNKEITEKIRINRLFKIALEKITAIPFLMVQEFWRWDVFSGKSAEDTLNGLNELREKFQGISAFTKELSFNLGGIGSVFSKISLLHHFFSFFFEFQMHESFCRMSESPIDECSFFEKVEVRDALRYVMSMGSSKPLNEIRLIVLGQSKIVAKYILNYFEPLMNWLKTENEKTGEFIGWKVQDSLNKSGSTKLRRKRSLDYSSEEIEEDDSDKASRKEPDRFQRFTYKRSKNKLDESKESERQRKSATSQQENGGKKAKNTFTGQQKQRRNSENLARESYYPKKRRSMTKNKSEDDSDESTTEENEVNEDLSSKKFTSRSVKRHSDLDKTYDKSKMYVKIVEEGNDNGQMLDSYNSRNSKHRSDYELLDEPYGDSKLYMRTPEKGDKEAGSHFTSKNKKRHSDSTLFVVPRESSYLKGMEKENENSQQSQKQTSANAAKRFSNSESLEQPNDNVNTYRRAVNEEEREREEDNDQMYNRHGLKNAKRQSSSDMFDMPHQNLKIYTRTLEKENDNSQMPDKYDPKNSHSDLGILDQSNYDAQIYSRPGEKGNNGQTSDKFTPIKAKRHMDLDSFEETNNGEKTYGRVLNNKEKSTYQKRSETGMNKNYENPENENSNSNSELGSNNKVRNTRRARKKQRRYTRDENVSAQSHQMRLRKDKTQSQNERLSRNAQWHTDTKKDISRLLHSIGFAVENDEKDKIKELKKKLKVGDSNSELKSGLVPKESSFENIIDFTRMKSDLGSSDAGEEKETNKFWAAKTYLEDNEKIMQSPSNLNKKDGMYNSHMSSSLISKPPDEKSMEKQDISLNGESGLVALSANQKINGNSESHFAQVGDSSGSRRISESAFQGFLQGNYGQKQIYSTKPELGGNKLRNDVNQMDQQTHGGKMNSNQFSNGFGYRYTPESETFQYKEKKEFRETPDMANNKSPYIIIVGQLTPEMREKLMQEKGTAFGNLEKQHMFQATSNVDEKKQSDKRSRESDQIYIVPVDLKNSQLNLMKPNLYAENEHEAGHDPNTERDQESEEEQLRLEDNSKLEDKNNFYKTGKENPSEFIISWNNDKTRKIVKRSKREHKREMGEDNLRLLRLAPMKDPVLEGLIGKSLNQARADDKNVHVLLHNNYLNGKPEYMSSANGDSSGSMGMHISDQSQTSSLQPASSLSSLASSVISALSPKRYSQVSKTSGQRQDSDLEEYTAKEAGGAQALGKQQKEQELPFLLNSGFRCNSLGGKKKTSKLHSDEDTRKLIDIDSSAKDDVCCKKVILNSCPSKSPNPGPCPCPCPLPCPMPCPCPPSPCPTSSSSPATSPSPHDEGKYPGPAQACPCPSSGSGSGSSSNSGSGSGTGQDICKKPSECSLVNCQFKITKAKKPHERLTIMIYDRINPPADLPEPYDALAVISEILQRIQCCSNKPSCQLTEEDPDYPANDNMDQLKGSENAGQDNKNKVQELSGEIPIMGNESSEEDETDDSSQNVQQAAGPSDENKYLPREKATPAIDQLTVFNKDKLKPVFIELRKIDDILKKRSQQE